MMDLWTAEVQDAVLKLIVAVLGIVVMWVGVQGKRYLAALEAKALESAQETGVQVLEQVAEAAVRYVKQVSTHKWAELTNPERLAIAADWVQSVLPGVEREVAVGAVESVLNRLKTGYGGLEPKAAETTTDTPDSIAARAADTAAEVAEAKLAQLRADVQEAKETATKAVDTLQSLARSFGLRDGDA